MDIAALFPGRACVDSQGNVLFSALCPTCTVEARITLGGAVLGITTLYDSNGVACAFHPSRPDELVLAARIAVGTQSLLHYR